MSITRLRRAAFALRTAESFDEDLGLCAVQLGDIPAKEADTAFSRYLLLVDDGMDPEDATAEAIQEVTWMPNLEIVAANRARAEVELT